MAILTGPEIANQRELGNIVIDPWDPKQLNPNSYNLRLSDELLIYVGIKRHDGTILLDMAQNNECDRVNIPKHGFVLEPGRLYLGSTVEYTETKNFVPMIEGRSSVGRLGLAAHVTAGYGDILFSGTWTLELTVVHPLIVHAGVQICQIIYSEARGDIQPYQGKYQGQRGPKASSLWKEFLKEV